MRSLEINKRDIYFANIVGEEPLFDEWGNETGEYKIIYSEPELLRINVSPAKGQVGIRQFGEIEQYDKILVTHKTNLDMNVGTILWVDNLDTTLPNDYDVKKIAISINSTILAIKKADIR